MGIIQYFGQNFFEQTSYGKNRAMGAETPVDYSPHKICTFVDIKCLYSAWVADAASFCSNYLRTTCVYVHVYIFGHM
jgi:hypothetical protein